MAPFNEAVNAKFARSEGEYQIYEGHVDGQWSVGAVPHGGYVLALVLEACLQHQSTTKHPDPIHVTAHYLRPTSIAEFQVRIRTLKAGRGFSNLTAELIQKDTLVITTHCIFGTNVDTSAEKPHFTIQPPSSFARRIPLYSHPSKASVARTREVWNFTEHSSLSRDMDINAKNAIDHPNRANSATIGGEGLEWGGWFGFTKDADKITSPALVFLTDVFINMPSLLPRTEREKIGPSWFPTLVLSVEFKAPIPKSFAKHADRTVGLYHSGRFLHDGRHDAYVEIWTAPTNFGEGKEKEGWREEQVCLAIATQMATVLPMAVNLSRNKAAESTPRL